jgi:hypothetical protein
MQRAAAGMIIGTAKEPVQTDDHVHWYYTGCTGTHGSALAKRQKCLGRATWRKDRFVSQGHSSRGRAG